MAIAFLLPALLTACGGEEESTDGAQDEPASVTVREDIEIGDYFFEPNIIEATMGNTVEVSLTNEGEQDHTFTLDELLVDEAVAAGEDAEVTFVPNEPGEFTFYCTIHPEEMQGALRIARPGEAPPGGDVEESPTEDASDGGGFGY
jgi:plastocyanin